MSAIVIRCNFNAAIGGGHLSRSLSLTRSAPLPVSLVVASSDKETVRSLANGLDVQIVPPEGFAEDLCLLSRSEDSPKSLILDISNSSTYESLSEFKAFVEQARSLDWRICLIDGMGQDSILHHWPGFKGDAVFTPYLDAREAEGPFRHFCGPDYFVLDSAYFPYLSRPRILRAKVENVLVTCGLSDPAGVSVLALQALIRSKRQLTIRVVIGGAFSHELRSELFETQRRSCSGVKVEILENCAQLATQMDWGDVAVSTTGLTRYELAAMGVPSIFVSHSELAEALHQPFAKKGIGISLGPRKSVDELMLYDIFWSLADDLPRRQLMSAGGRRIVDGRGGARIFQRVLEGLK